MNKVRFIWDSQKSKSNKAKHGVSFEEAQTVFCDENAKVIYDPDHSVDEDRFILLGVSFKLRLLVACYCYRENGTVIRIFSARRANRREEEQYKEGL